MVFEKYYFQLVLNSYSPHVGQHFDFYSIENSIVNHIKSRVTVLFNKCSAKALNDKEKSISEVQNIVTSTDLLAIEEIDTCVIDAQMLLTESSSSRETKNAINTTLKCVLVNPSYEEWKNGASLEEYQESVNNTASDKIKEWKNGASLEESVNNIASDKIKEWKNGASLEESVNNTASDKIKEWKNGASLEEYQKSENNTASDKIKGILFSPSKCQSPVTSCHVIESSASTFQKRIGGGNDDISKRIKLDVPQFLWPDIYPPINLDELALDPARLREVETWFNKAFSQNNYNMYQMQSHRLLVLSGPPGSSKTSVIKLIAKKRNLHIIEWENPQTFTTDHSDESVPVMAPFELFLSYNGRNPHKQCILNQNNSQIIIVEDLPCLINSGAKKQFHQAIKAHIKHPRTSFPLILIISEAHSVEDFDEYVGKNSFQSLSLRSILPNDIISSNQCTTIEFLPINNTQMERGLKLFINKVYVDDFDKQEDALQLCPFLAKQCHGDIRLAINTLQFLMVEDPIKNLGGTEDPNDEAHKEIQQKINSLQNKLIHPREVRERMPLMYTPESTLDNMCTEYHTYLCMLRNYYPHFYGNILECQFASECLSDAELLMNNQDFR
ncbi:1413_t:CDS:2, partial [Racocetra fulgida]